MVSRLAALFRHQGSKRAKPVRKDAPTKAVSGKAKPNKKRAKAASKDREEPKSTQALWRKFGRKWQAGPGSVVLPQQDAADRLPKKHVWLQFRSGMGCSVRVWFAERAQPEKPKDRQRRFCTKWSQFRVSSISSMQSCTIRAHAESLVHKMAWKAFCNKQLLHSIVQEPLEDSYLQKGGVPQVADWLRLWKALRSTNLSLRGLEQLSFTDSFAACDRTECKGISREAYKQMVAVFVDVLREEKREALRKAVAVCISTDDKSSLEIFHNLSFCFSMFGIVFAGLSHWPVLGRTHSGPWRDVSYQACLQDGSVCRGVVRATGIHPLSPVFLFFTRESGTSIRWCTSFLSETSVHGRARL